MVITAALSGVSAAIVNHAFENDIRTIGLSPDIG
jgi:hypothetical protein